MVKLGHHPVKHMLYCPHLSAKQFQEAEKSAKQSAEDVDILSVQGKLPIAC